MPVIFDGFAKSLLVIGTKPPQLIGESGIRDVEERNALLVCRHLKIIDRLAEGRLACQSNKNCRTFWKVANLDSIDVPFDLLDIEFITELCLNEG
jgi:hypothetical protein